MNFRKILIVDDSLTARMMIINYLQISGLENSEFIEADDGSEALNIIEKQMVDLVITDVIMPKLDGNSFVKRLRLKEKFKHTPIVILTSLSEHSVSAYDPSDLWLRVIQKPVTPEKLKQILEGMS